MKGLVVLYVQGKCPSSPDSAVHHLFFVRIWFPQSPRRVETTGDLFTIVIYRPWLIGQKPAKANHERLVAKDSSKGELRRLPISKSIARYLVIPTCHMTLSSKVMLGAPLLFGLTCNLF